MLSVIICSRQPDISAALRANIDTTVGSAHEIVVIDNSERQYSIFSAYNEGVRRSKGDILCFMHDDIVFRSKDWGEVVYKAFENKKCGLVGVIGCQFLSNKVQPWWNLGHHLGCITQGYIEGEEYRTFQDGEPIIEESKEGVAVDGLWFCIKRDLFDLIGFDEITYDGFHCYDVDICMQVIRAGYQVRVLRNILVEHKSGGNVSDKYFEQLARFVRKWDGMLPISRGLHWGHIGTILYQLYRDKDNR